MRRTRGTSRPSFWRRTTRRARTCSPASNADFKGEIVDEVYTPLGQLDFSAELAKIAADKPEAFFTFMPGGMGVNLVKQYRQAGLASIPFLSAFTAGRVDASGREG